MEKQYRQGDVLLRMVDVIPNEAIVQPEDNGRVVLAYGEVTGHAHAIETGLAFLYRKGADEYLLVRRGAVLRHEEHAPITLPPGSYRLIRQREWSDMRTRNVAD